MISRLLLLLCRIWNLTLSLSAVIGVISWVIALKNKLSHKENGADSVKYKIANSGLNFCIFVFILSGIVGVSLTVVPDITGYKLTEAKILLTSENLNPVLEAGKTFSNNPDAMVIGQSTAPGTLAAKGSDIIIYLDNSTSTLNSQETVTVPNLIGYEQNAAKVLLIKSKLSYAVNASRGEDINEAQLYIVGQSLPADSTVPINSKVYLDVSSNKPEIPAAQEVESSVYIPNVVGCEEEEAIALLSESGLDVGVFWVEGNDGPFDHYYIIDQSIPAGSTVPAGSHIELERGGVKPGSSVIVPNVLGMEQIEATKLLIETGLQFQVWWTESNNIISEYYYIIDQSIPAGYVVPAGTLIKLELSVNKP